MASSGLPPKSPCSSFTEGHRHGCSIPVHHSSHLEVIATALGGKVTAAPDCLDSVLPCPALPEFWLCPRWVCYHLLVCRKRLRQMNAQNCPPQPQLNAATMSLRGREHCHFTAHMAAPLQLQKTLRAKPTSCCTQFKARTWTPVPHTPTDPNHWKLALLILWSNLPSQTHSQAKCPCSPRILTIARQAIYWGGARNRTPNSSTSDAGTGQYVCSSSWQSAVSSASIRTTVFSITPPQTIKHLTNSNNFSLRYYSLCFRLQGTLR